MRSRLALTLLLVCSPLAAQIYKGAIVVDATDGRLLYTDQPDYRGPAASVTKLMTFLIVHDAIEAGEVSLNTRVQVSGSDARIGGSQVWLKQGETFTVGELLHALMIKSANDAAHALARTVAGSPDAFVERMNDRASALGLGNTRWHSPHGLPPRSRRLAETDQSSPRDLAALSRVLLSSTDILRYSAIKKRPFGEGTRDKPVMMENTNHLVGRVEGVDGLKTGFTRAAGFCLSATATRDGKRLIAVIMGSPTSQERDIKMAELIEYGFVKLNEPPLPPPLFVQPAVSDTNPLSIVPLREASADDSPANTSADPPTVSFSIPAN